MAIRGNEKFSTIYSHKYQYIIMLYWFVKM